jgi:hypothetical protein
MYLSASTIAELEILWLQKYNTHVSLSLTKVKILTKKLTHYKDTVTGRYVEKKKWQRSRAHGSTRYKRTYERYVKPKQRKITPAPPPQGEVIERLKYQSKNKLLDIETVSKNGKITSIRIGRRTYRQRASILRLTPLIEGARLTSGYGTRKTRRR